MSKPLQAPSVAIIGGGAAGFFSAIALKENCPSAEVHIFEKGAKPLAKVRVTGGGRCNLTNSFAHIADLKQAYPRGAKLLKRLFRHFNHEDTMAWFEGHGVALVTQDDQCVFPRSQQSQSVIDALTITAQRLGIQCHCAKRVTQIVPQASGFQLQLSDSDLPQGFDAVIVTTGGEPRTKGWEWLSALGHEIVAPQPSLFTFNIADPNFQQLMGTVVEEVQVGIPATKFRSAGPLLITHWGVSGPSVLKLSAHAAVELANRDYRFPFAIAWSNTTNAEAVMAELQRLAQSTQKLVRSLRPFDLPARLWEYLTTKANIPAERRWGEVGRKTLNRLVELLTNDTYQINGRSVHKEEFVTAGGVALSSIDAKTLESKHCPNLFFAGEVLDIDGITGGFNLQAAWTTAFVAGTALSEKFKPELEAR